MPDSFTEFLYMQGVLVIGAACKYAVAYLQAATRDLEREED